MEIAFLDHINAASLVVQIAGLSQRPLFLSQKRQIANLDAIALGQMWGLGKNSGWMNAQNH